jgi:hypothetical protein
MQDLSPQSLSLTVDSFESRPLTLLVYSSKRQEIRRVTLIPSREWSTPTFAIPNGSSSNPSSSAAPSSSTPHSHSHSHSHSDHNHSHNPLTASHSRAASLSSSPSLLGLSLRFCTPQAALTNVWHILEVLQDSPAESAGLVPYGDWIIGWAGGVLNSENDFYDVVEGVSQFFRPLSALTTDREQRVRAEALPLNDGLSMSTSRSGYTYTLTISSELPQTPFCPLVEFFRY